VPADDLHAAHPRVRVGEHGGRATDERLAERRVDRADVADDLLALVRVGLDVGDHLDATAAVADPRGDLIQEMILELWRAWPRFDESRSAFSTWMHKVAMNVAICPRLALVPGQ